MCKRIILNGGGFSQHCSNFPGLTQNSKLNYGVSSPVLEFTLDDSSFAFLSGARGRGDKHKLLTKYFPLYIIKKAERNIPGLEIVSIFV